MNLTIDTMESNWMHKQVSLYSSHSDNIGRPATYRDILLTQFGRDLPAIVGLRNLDKEAVDYKIKSKPFKSTLQCFTPAALFANKAHGQVTEVARTGMMQMDFDHNDIKEYDLEELKNAVFSLPFIGFCGVSCSGIGFYALAHIAEPQRLAEYAEHCFSILKSYGIKPDESKGKKPENLRYLSYDANMLIRENPEPLLIKQFSKKQVQQKPITYSFGQTPGNEIGLVKAELNKILMAQSGERWATVQRVAFTLGGLNNHQHLQDIYNAIQNNSAFTGEEEKYMKCARVCFDAGINKPLDN